MITHRKTISPAPSAARMVVPPRVEYRLTSFGEKFVGIMDGVERLQRELDLFSSET